jgi:hypothetical protein
MCLSSVGGIKEASGQDRFGVTVAAKARVRVLFCGAASKVDNQPALELSKRRRHFDRGTGRITVDAREKE